MGRGANGAVPEQLPSGHRGCHSGLGGGGLLAVGNAVGAGVGAWECLWGRVKARVLGGAPPPPPPPAVPAHNKVLKKHGPNGNGRWTRCFGTQLLRCPNPVPNE